jgi:D-alanyl-D-alanine carboxypeptidase
MSKKAPLGVLLLLCLAPLAHADGVDDFIRGHMEQAHIPGVSIAVIKRGVPVKVKSYGVSNLELNTPASSDTVYRIGSYSKQMIAAGILLLVRDDKISLTDNPSKFLEGSPATWNDITLTHLLNHTSGLIREAPGYSPLRVQSDAELIRSAYSQPLVFKTGEKWQYSNLGYFILAEVITKASGQPWPQFMTERVFKPLGMHATRALDVAPVIPHRASGYVFTRNEYRNSATLLALRPSGAFMSSLSDLIKWDDALNRGTLLPKASLDQMWSKGKLNDGSTVGYGFGWEVDEVGGHRRYGHGGSINGFRSYSMRLPDDDVAVIVLTNNEVAQTPTIALNIASKYVKGLLPKRNVVKLTPAELQMVAGNYRLPQMGTVTMEPHARGLKMRVAQFGVETLLLPESATIFFVEIDPRIRYQFQANSNGQIQEVAVLEGDRQVNSGVRE